MQNHTLPLEERNLEVEVANVPATGRGKLTRKAKAWAGGGGRVSLLLVLLLVLDLAIPIVPCTSERCHLYFA